MSDFSPLRHYAYSSISKMIQRGELKPSEKISEASICNMLGVSRTPAREALAQLAYDGVLTYSPHRGYVVKPFDVKEQDDTFVLLAMLDAFAARLATPFLTNDDFCNMHELIEQMDIAIKYKKYDDYNSLQERFHDTYIQKCGNLLLRQSLEKLRNGTIRSSYYGCADNELFPILYQMNREHEGILALLEARDAEAVEHELRFNHWINKYPQAVER